MRRKQEMKCVFSKFSGGEMPPDPSIEEGAPVVPTDAYGVRLEFPPFQYLATGLMSCWNPWSAKHEHLQLYSIILIIQLA